MKTLALIPSSLLTTPALAEELVPRIASIEEQGRDQYGQILARIGLNDGGDWAGAMIDRDLAVPFDGPDGKCPPLTNWCGK